MLVMKITRLTTLIGFLCFSPVLFAEVDASVEKEAEKLMDTIGMDVMFEKSISQMLAIQLQQNPGLAPYREIMQEFLQKHMSWQSLKPDMLRIYTEAFSASELKEINAFYATDVGKKTIKVMPSLITQGSQLGASRVQNNIAELEAMIEAESERLKQARQQPQVQEQQ